MMSRNRNRWLLAVCMIALLAASCAPASSEAEPPAGADQAQGPAEPETSGNGQIRRSQSLVDSEELIGLGELGLLPTLLQSLGTVSECDFDDAFSTCQ